MKLSIVYFLDRFVYEKSLQKLLRNKNKDIEIIVVNRILNKDKCKDLNKYKNIHIIDGFQKSLKECIEISSKIIRGEYVFFTCTSANVERKTIRKALAVIKKENPNLLFLDNNLYKMNFSDKEIMKKCGGKCYSICFYSYIFKRNLLNNLNYIKDLCDSETSVQLLVEIFKENLNISIITSSGLFYNDELWLNHDCYNKDWYTYTIKNIYIPLAQNHKLNFDQQSRLYLSIFYKFLINKNGSNKEVLLNEERNELFEAIGSLFLMFDDEFFNKLDIFDMICSQNYGYKYLMLSFREKIEEYTLSLVKNEIYSKINEHSIFLQTKNVVLDAINYHQKELTIDAHFDYIQLYNYSPKCLYAIVDGKRVELTKTEIYSLTKYFAISTSKQYTFQLTVPIHSDCTVITFMLELDGLSSPVPLQFSKSGSRLTTIFPKSYWQYKDILLSYHDNSIVVKKNTAFLHIKHEFAFFFDLLLHSTKGYRLKNVFLRLIYWLLKPFYSKKRIWLYFDKLYKADDNGEFAIKYSSRLSDNISHYYVINKNSYDLPRLKNEGIKILNFNSLKHKLMTLYAENIVATHPDIIAFCGYGKNLELAFRNLFNANIICIAHGLTMQKNAEVQNRIYDNTMFYTTSSKYEVEHLLKPVYGYSQDQVALTGMARFDVMISNSEKKILITPTWRRSVSGVSNFNSPKDYNSEFKHSTYYKIYNSLINDQKLISCAKDTGHQIIFLLHPAMSSQINDYDRNEYVTFLQATSDISYHKILSEASLMVTDYSGVQYDFAYMHKPIIYYHPSLLPPRFEEGALKYDTMGFGPICTKHDEIVDELIKYMRNDCQIEKKYDDRINNFFAFHDTNNGKRIYEAILDFTEKMKD